ncbi:hypothetical protein [Nocardia niigatensis]|uniref:hypothetical protein n=1 Tax=Nocardia niigatensis TaxID=209249 RepID=UPI0007C5165D|nr:hypothetical protein [Nocardia niigatensis]
MKLGRAILKLPWTAPPLSLNDRGRTPGARYAHARRVAEVRATVHRLARAAQLPRGLDRVTVLLHYRPRDNRRRDTDNLVATLKPACDALAAGTRAHPGYGMVPDDIPRHMAKPEPIIHEAERGKRGALWLEVSWEEHEHDWDCLGVTDGQIQYECRDPSCGATDSEPED